MLDAREPGRPTCLKSHLPLDRSPYRLELRYVVVGRDPSDVFMSLHNDHGNYGEPLMSHRNVSLAALSLGVLDARKGTITRPDKAPRAGP